MQLVLSLGVAGRNLSQSCINGNQASSFTAPSGESPILRARHWALLCPTVSTEGDGRVCSLLTQNSIWFRPFGQLDLSLYLSYCVCGSDVAVVCVCASDLAVDWFDSGCQSIFERLKSFSVAVSDTCCSHCGERRATVAGRSVGCMVLIVWNMIVSLRYFASAAGVFLGIFLFDLCEAFSDPRIRQQCNAKCFKVHLVSQRLPRHYLYDSRYLIQFFDDVDDDEDQIEQ